MGKHLDYKCTTWCRLHLSDDVDLEKVKELIKSGMHPLDIGYDQDFIENTEWENIIDCEEYITPEENDGYPTIELYNECGDLIFTNEINKT